MNIKLTSGTYKSIEAGFEWNDIPPFVVLTGANGSGKTHLLELIHQNFRARYPGQREPLSEAVLDVTGITGRPGDAVLATSQWTISASSATFAQVQQVATQVANDIRSGNKFSNDEEGYYRAKRKEYVASKFAHSSGANPKDIEPETLIKSLPYEQVLSTRSDPRHLSEELSRLFCSYQLKVFQMNIDGEHDAAAIEQNLGRPPWKLLDDFLCEAGLSFKFKPPSKVLEAEYNLRLIDLSQAKEVNPNGLSSGEKALVALAIWLYTSTHTGILPKLILLDEPEAHLHPSMIPPFIRAIDRVLVKQHGARVILATHRPETVAYAPEGSLFEMHKDAPRVRKSNSLARTTFLLTSGIMSVLPRIRCVVVEDKDDVKFYTLVSKLHSRDSMSDSAVALVFQPASVKHEKGEVPGGKTVVAGWVSKLQSAGLEDLVRGIIDRDLDNVTGRGVLRIERYSFENYLLDPIVVYAALLDAGKAPTIELPFKIHRGEESKLKELDEASLNAIAQVIFDQVEKYLCPKDSEKELIPVRFTCGKTLQYPIWLRDLHPKNKLLVAYRACFGNDHAITPDGLMGSFERVAMLPTDLATLMEALLAPVDAE